MLYLMFVRLTGWMVRRPGLAGFYQAPGQFPGVCNMPALNPGGDIDGSAAPPRRSLLQALVLAMLVIVAGLIY